MSDPASRSQRRAAGWITVGALVAIAIVVPLTIQASRPDQQEVYSAALNTADELQRTPIDGLGVSSSDVWDALVAGNPPSGSWKFRSSVVSDLDLRSAGADSRGDLYEITRDDGEYPVCLIVSDDGDPFSRELQIPYASVEDSAC